MTADSTEYFYNKGLVSINILEGDEHVSIEFFPSSQSKESFESGEFDNIFKISTFLNNEDSKYSWSIPTDISEGELKEMREVATEFLKNYLADSSKEVL